MPRSASASAISPSSGRRAGRAGSELLKLAALYGIQPSYVDSFGQRQAASEEAVRAALLALGAPLELSVDQALRARRSEMAARMMEPLQVAWDGRLRDVPVRLPHASPLLGSASAWEVSVQLEDGATSTLVFRGQELEISRDSSGGDTVLVRLPCRQRLPAGYHSLRVEATAARSSLHLESIIVAAPTRCYAPADARRTWGAFLPLYALRSRHDWGTGDFESLCQLHGMVRGLGGCWTGTLPLLATFLDHPFEPSPYSPVSRLYWNELFIAPEAEPEFAESAAARRVAHSAPWLNARRRLNESDLVDYREAMRLKRRVLEVMAESLHRVRGSRGEQFRRYVADRPDLRAYARFRAVQEQRRAEWTRWPRRMREGTLTAADSDAGRERYHQYVQWIAELQLAKIAGQDSSGGLYLDFPLGVHRYGYDVWRAPLLFAQGATAGAPPDSLFPDGQNWGFPPLHPERIRQDGYRYLRECLRHQMRHAKLLRIDHILGFNRLYWIPQGIATRAGVYIQYRAEEMYAVLSLESHRARTMIVGENLGTVPASVNRALKRHSALGMHILQFATSPSGVQAPGPEEVAGLNTHDTPTFAGFLHGDEITGFERLGVFTAREAVRMRKQRRETMKVLAKALKVRGFARGLPGRPAQQKLLAACWKWLARSSAKIVIVNLEDAWLERQPQNIPGTGPGTKNPEQPNWRRKARLALEGLSRPAIRKMLQQCLRSRNGSPRERV